MNYVQQY